jgi:Zn-dependent peptidase ImmA (M78 family)
MNLSNPPFMQNQAIEHEASNVLRGYFKSKGLPVTLPIPVENIVGKHLGLSFEIRELPDNYILGYYDAADRIIVVNEHIDPMINEAANQGRFNFTIAHEIGHHSLHRYLILNELSQFDLLNKSKQASRFICRKEDTVSRLEQQANRFASALLMPANLLKKKWNDLVIENGAAKDNSSKLNILTNAIAAHCLVSYEAAAIRISQLGLAIDTNQQQGIRL